MDVIKEVESIYKGLRQTEPSQAIIGLATLIVVFAVINKFIKAYREAFSDGEKPANVKHFFNLFYTYIFCIAAVLLAPVTFHLVEYLLGIFQDEMISRYAKQLNSSAIDEITRYVKSFEQDISDAGILESLILRTTQNITMSLYIFFFGLQKYLFYMFSAGRYLYLLLLEIIAPFAIFSWMEESTRHYTYSFLKNLFVCYMMIPAFLIASTFSDELALGLSRFIGMESQTNLIIVVFSFIFKVFLLGKSASYVRQLI